MKTLVIHTASRDRNHWWENFYGYVRAKKDSVVTFSDMVSAFSEIGGKFRLETENIAIVYYIDFEQDEDAIAFLLRWS